MGRYPSRWGTFAREPVLPQQHSRGNEESMAKSLTCDCCNTTATVLTHWVSLTYLGQEKDFCGWSCVIRYANDRLPKKTTAQPPKKKAQV